MLCDSDNFESDNFDCFFCYVDARNNKNVIYVRVENCLGNWNDVPICLSCYDKKRHLE